MKYTSVFIALLFFLIVVSDIKAQETASTYFIKAKNCGGSLPRSVLQSVHMVESEEQCSLKCLEEKCCFGFNFKSGITNQCGYEKNCQLSSKNMDNMEVINGNGWAFYQVLSTDKKSNDTNTNKTLECSYPDESVYSYEDKNCPYSWKKFDCGCYYFSEITTTWNAARDDCRARGGDLAVPKSHENNQHIYEALKERNIGKAWIGLYRGTGSFSNKFYTIENVEVSYVNWKNGEPNNSGGQEDCGEILGGESYIDWNAHSKWNDLACSNSRSFVCHLNL